MDFLNDTTVIVALSTLLATIVFEIVAPSLWNPHARDPLHSLTAWLQHVHYTERPRSLGLNVPYKRAVLVHAVNLGMIGGLIVLAFLTDRRTVFLVWTGYVLVGATFNALIRRVPISETFGASWRGRLWIRLFYAWGWPINVITTVIGIWRLFR